MTTDYELHERGHLATQTPTMLIIKECAHHDVCLQKSKPKMKTLQGIGYLEQLLNVSRVVHSEAALVSGFSEQMVHDPGVCKCPATQLSPNRSECGFYAKAPKINLRGTVLTPETRMNR